MKWFFMCLFLSIIVGTMGSSLLATDYYWNYLATGYVNDPANWGPYDGNCPGYDPSDNATIASGGTATVDGSHQFYGAFNALNVNDGELVVDAGADVQIATGMVGGNYTYTTGTLTINDGGSITTTNRFDIGFLGNAHVVLSGTSTTNPATLTIAGNSFIGVDNAGVVSSAVVELSGTAEMHIGTAQNFYENCHMAFGDGTSMTITMSDDSKFTIENVPGSDTQPWGWYCLGDMGGTGDITLFDSASFSVTQSHLIMGASTGGKAHITLNDSSSFSVAQRVHLGAWDTNGDEAIITLNGGTFAAKQFIAESNATSAVINCNGGTLKALEANNNFLKGPALTVNVQTGGATIDTNGFNVVVVKNLQHDPALGTPDGGLTKVGTGTLTLNSQSTYDGPTVVNDGTLQLQTSKVSQFAYTPDNAEGNRTDGPYSLGRAFTVKAGKTIEVTQLGVFDSAGDGLVNSHVVHISSADGAADYAVETIASGTTDPYQQGFRMATLSSPVSLAEGSYMVWVESIGLDDAFHGNLVSWDTGATSAISIDGSWVGVPAPSFPIYPWNDGSGNADADATFTFYDPAGWFSADVLPVTTPVRLGGPAGSTPTLDLQGANQQIASLADVAGAEVLGVVTNSALDMPVVLTLGAETGSTTYGGTIEGNLSLVKTGGGEQTLSGALSYSGDTTVLGGTLNVNALNTSPNVSVSGGGVLNAGSIVAETLTIGGAKQGLSPQAVPEPSTIVLLALAGLGVLWATRRR